MARVLHVIYFMAIVLLVIYLIARVLHVLCFMARVLINWETSRNLRKAYRAELYKSSWYPVFSEAKFLNVQFC
jgi:uncharacterized protein HemY